MNKKEVNVLITSAGRRGALVRCFKKTIKGMKGIEGKVVSVDASPLASALYLSDKHYIVPRISDSNYINVLLNICKEENIKLIILTIDTELLILSQNREKFEKNGIRIAISDTKVIEICSDKLKTFQFFKENNIPTVETFSYRQVDKIEKLNYPLFIKPCSGSAGINTYKINNRKELDFFINYIDNPVIQEYAEGKEFTMDILADFNGKVLNIVPRERIEVRAGEMNKGRTVKDEKIIEYAKNIVEKLEAIGPITIQCFKKGNEIKFTEINPRIGGGYPLSFAAGANYPELLIRMVLGEKVAPRLGEFEENLIMLRWEDAVFIRKDDINLKKNGVKQLPIRALLFDLDDTLYEEKQFVKSGFIKVAEFIECKFKINKKDFYRILIDIFNSGSRGNIFNLTLEKVNVAYEEDIIQSMVKIYREHNPKIRLAEDVKSLLVKLKEIYSLGIITDGYYEVQKKKVQALRLEEMFDSIIYTDEYGREYWKPNIFSYKLALERFQIVSGEAIYIGDNPHKDFIGAKKIGIPTVRVINQNREYSNIRLNKEYEADYEIRELHEIINVLKVLK